MQALETILRQTLWRRRIADGATALSGGSGSGVRNTFIPHASDPENLAGTWFQSLDLDTTGWCMVPLGGNVDVLYIRGAFRTTALTGAGIVGNISASSLQALALFDDFGPSKDGNDLFNVPTALRSGSLLINDAGVAGGAGVRNRGLITLNSQRLEIFPIDPALISPLHGSSISSEHVVSNGAILPVPPTDSLANILATDGGLYTRFGFYVGMRQGGHTSTSASNPYPAGHARVSGLRAAYLQFGCKHTAATSFDNAQWTGDGQIEAIGLKIVNEEISRRRTVGGGYIGAR